MKALAAPVPASRIPHPPSLRFGAASPASRAAIAHRLSPIGYAAVPTVDAVMVEERAASFTKRSIKTSAKLAGLKLAVSMCDLTTLEGKDTPGKVAYLCRKALQPIEPKYDVPSCAAVCIYPNLAKPARKVLGENSPVHVAAVATGGEGALGSVVGLIGLELPLVPPVLYARTRYQ